LAPAVPQPVAGEIIERSFFKTLGSFLFAVIMLCAGILLVVAWLSDHVFQDAGEPSKVSLWGFLLGIGLIVFGPILGVFAVCRWLAYERVILGRDRLSRLARSASK